MRTILVDDESWALQKLKRDCERNDSIEVVGAFSNAEDALEYARNSRIDLALLDVELPMMDGLELGLELRKIYPDLVMIYITGNGGYALSSIKVKADYFMLKPYSEQDVDEILERAILLSGRQVKRVFIRTFGFFDVFVDGVPIYFTSTKAKELLAVMVDRCGGYIYAEEAISIMWEDRPCDSTTRSLYRQAAAKLRGILKQYNIEDILLEEKQGRRLNTDLIDCDYYMLRRGDKKAAAQYFGQYMVQYSWAENTNASLNDYYRADR